MKKIILTILSVFLITSLTACKDTKETSASSSKEGPDTSSSEITEDTSEVEKILKEAYEQMEQDKQKQLDAKQARIDSEEPLIELTGKITGLLTKPESGLDIYQVTVKIESIENDANNLYQDGKNQEYQYFVSPSEHTNVDFDALKNGMTIKIKTFQDANLTDTPPKQTDELDIVSIEIVN